MVGNWLTFWGKLYYLICEMDALIRLLSDKEWRPPLAFSVMDFYNRNSYGGKGDRNPLIKTKSKQNFMKPGTGRSWRICVILSASAVAWLFRTCSIAPVAVNWFLRLIESKSTPLPSFIAFICLYFPFDHQVTSLWPLLTSLSLTRFPALFLWLSESLFFVLCSYCFEREADGYPVAIVPVQSFSYQVIP